jgi:hypothetical protein
MTRRKRFARLCKDQPFTTVRGESLENIFAVLRQGCAFLRFNKNYHPNADFLPETPYFEDSNEDFQHKRLLAYLVTEETNPNA